MALKGPRWLGRAIGEISKLLRGAGGIITGGTGAAYQLDSRRVDYALARALYENTEDNYKLGASFCRRIIHGKSGFMGVPSFHSTDPEAEEVLKAFFGDNVSRMGRTQKRALIEGDCIVWITREETKQAQALYPESKVRLVYNIIPNEELVRVDRDPLTKEPVRYTFKTVHEWHDDEGKPRKTTITQTVTAEKRVIKQEGDKIPDLPDEEINRWGFIPIVLFHNEEDETRQFGRSDLEPVEPFLKAYHDLLLNALKGSKMHSTPRLMFKIKDVRAFLANNFGITDPVKFAAEGGKVNLDGHEFLIFGDGEDANFIEIKSPSGGLEALLKFLFYCIVDASEIPEFLFGVHTPSSLSSVQEQMPAFVRTITRKRENFAEAWKKLARIVLAMTAQAEGRKFATHAVTLEWPEVDPRDVLKEAQALQATATGLKTAVEGGFLSEDAAAEHLRQYIPSMAEYAPEDETSESERDRIIRNRVERERLADGALGLPAVKTLKTELSGAGVK